MSLKLTFYRYFKKPFFGRFNKPWRWPEKIDQSQWQRMKLKSPTGDFLSAMVAEAHTKEAKGAVLMSHPMGAAAKGFWLKHGHSEILRRAGYHVMVFDFNGFGESKSTTMDFPLDVLAAGRALQNRYPDLPIAVMGSSMGGAMSICAMIHDHPFKVAIIESAFPTLLHFWKQFLLPKIGVQLTQLFYPSGEQRLRPIHAAASIKEAPDILLIYGEADKFTPVEHGKILWRTLRDHTKVEFWSVEKAEHTHAYKAQPEKYPQKIIEFLDSHISR